MLEAYFIAPHHMAINKIKIMSLYHLSNKIRGVGSTIQLNMMM